MKSSDKIFIFAAVVVAAFSLSGCSAPEKLNKEADDTKRDQALQHFLQGSVLDLKGNYAQAILEYQDALQYAKDAAIYHAISRNYAILNKHGLAVQMGKEAVRLEPDNRTYRQTLAEIYLGAADIENSIKEYEEIVRLDPYYREGWRALAHVRQVIDPEKALKTYEEIVSRFGPDGDSYFQMAQIYSATERYDKAVEALNGMLEINPENFEIKKAIGDMYLRQDSVGLALKIYDNLVELHPDHLELRAALAHAHLVRHDYDKAAEQFYVILKQDSLSADEQIKFGQVFISFVEKDSAVAPYAIEMFKKIQKAYPADWRPYWFLGAIYNIERDDSSALEYFSKVTELAKWNPDGWVSTASVFYDGNRFEEAIRILNEAKKHVGDEFRIYFLLGISHQRLRQNAEAVSSLERAVQLDGKSIEAMSALGLVYDEMKRYEDSDTIYEKALRLDPGNHLILNNYGYSLAERGSQLERALGMAKQAVALQPANQSYLDTYGWIYYRLGEYREAEIYVRKAVELGSASPVILDHMGDIYFRLKEKEKAMQSWQKALELDPGNELLKEKIDRGSL